MLWWQRAIASWHPKLRSLYYKEIEELRDRHAQEMAELDQWKAEVLDYIEDNKRTAMQDQLDSLEQINSELNFIESLPDRSMAREEFLHFMRVAVETRIAVLNGELESDEWREVLERSFQVRSR